MYWYINYLSLNLVLPHCKNLDFATIDVPSNWNSRLSRLQLPFTYGAYCYLVQSSLLILSVATESVGILQGMFWAAWNWFCSSKPLQYVGWPYSKVVISIADFTLRFFLFVSHCDLQWRKKPTNDCWLIGLGWDGYNLTSVYSWFHRGNWLHPVWDCQRRGGIVQSSLWRCVRGGSIPFLY